MSSTSDLGKGVVIKYNGELYVITEYQHVKPGKGGAFVRTKMKNISNGKIIDKTFRTGEVFEVTEVRKQTMQYLYKDGDNYAFMNMESYEQIEVEASLLGDDVKYLKEGIKVVVGLQGDNPVLIELPKKIQYKVIDAPPAVRGDSASGNVTKDIVLDNGLEIKAPIFIKEGDEVMVNTETGDYTERAK